MQDTRRNDIEQESGPGLEREIEKRYRIGVVEKKPRISKNATDPVAIALGERVWMIRTAQGKKQEDLADASGLDRRYISRVESGVQNSTLRALARIADALDVTLSALFQTVPGYGGPIENRPYERDG